MHLWWPIHATEWASSVVAVFTKMPSLEKLLLLATADRNYYNELDAMQIRTILCKNLKDLFLQSPIPEGMVSMIGQHCKNLTGCFFDERINITDDNICQLSQSCPNLREIRLRQAKRISTLHCFTTLHQLE